MYEGYMAVGGPKLFNCLPKYIRDKSGCSVNSFKCELDRFLKNIPDEPVLPGYAGGNNSLYGSNSLIDVTFFTKP